MDVRGSKVEPENNPRKTEIILQVKNGRKDRLLYSHKDHSSFPELRLMTFVQITFSSRIKFSLGF